MTSLSPLTDTEASTKAMANMSKLSTDIPVQAAKVTSLNADGVDLSLDF